MAVKVVVIGAGASGLVAAIMAARAGAEVILLEHKDRVGKKILMTGNGKCNLTNMSNIQGKYYGDNLQDIYHILERFTAADTINFFKSLGLYTKEKKDGGVYPVSEQASSVLDVLRTECEHLKIKVMTSCEIYYIQNGINSGEVNTNCGKIHYNSLIISTGGCAAPVSGSDGSGYSLVKKMGHTVIEPLPALVQLRCEGKFFKAIAGVRSQAALTLMINNKISATEKGELQLTDYGISGIPVFQFSRLVSKALYKNKKCEVIIDFATYLPLNDIEQVVCQTKEKMTYKTVEEWLGGMVHKKIAVLICKMQNISPQTKVSEVSAKLLIQCLYTLKNFKVLVKETNPFENAQVCCGGVPLSEIDENMQSKKCSNVYLTGELLDCDGICGGYNLQWAWATGAIAGTQAAKQHKQKKLKGKNNDCY